MNIIGEVIFNWYLFWVAVPIIGLYIMGLLIARWFWIIKPNINHLDVQIREVEARLKSEQVQPEKIDPSEKIIIQNVEKMLEQAKSSLASRMHDYFLGNAENQLRGWRLAHEAERLAIDLYPPEVLEIRLRVAHERLIMLDLKEAKVLACRIRELFMPAYNKAETALGRACLKEALSIIHEQRDSYFERLSDWNNKAVWFVYMTLLIIIALMLSNQSNPLLLLVGAIGGLLSKLRGAVKREDVPIDYGVSWTTLFLTPLIGALTGWGGILLTILLLNAKILGEIFSNFELVWAKAEKSPEVLALAIVFGYSATLFEKLVEKFEGKTGATAEEEKDPV